MDHEPKYLPHVPNSYRVTNHVPNKNEFVNHVTMVFTPSKLCSNVFLGFSETFTYLGV